MLKQTGAQGQPTVFLITDSQIKDERFLEDVDSLLNTGEVPNLFAPDEKGEIMEAVAGPAQAAAEDKNAEFSPLALFAFFVNRCRDNLHVVIAFSPIGDAFRSRIRKFPSLINCCNIDWFQAWPEDALEKVARSSLQKVDIDDEQKAACVDICKYFHVSSATLSEKYVTFKLSTHSHIDSHLITYNDKVLSKTGPQDLCDTDILPPAHIGPQDPNHNEANRDDVGKETLRERPRKVGVCRVPGGCDETRSGRAPASAQAGR